MQENLSVVNLPKSTTFQMRINPDVKAKVEDIFSKCGLTLTDAINVFLQQSINAEGIPFPVSIKKEENEKEMKRQEAIAFLMKELEKGKNSKQCVPIEVAAKEFGVEL